MSRMANRNDNMGMGSRNESRNERKDIGSRMSRKDRSKYGDRDDDRHSDIFSRQNKANTHSPSSQRGTPGPKSRDEKEETNDKDKDRDRPNDSRASKYKNEDDNGKKSRNSRADNDGKRSPNGTDSRADNDGKRSRNGNDSRAEHDDKKSRNGTNSRAGNADSSRNGNKSEEDGRKGSQNRNKSRADDHPTKSRNDIKSCEDDGNEVKLVKLADSAERYDYMAEFMMDFAKNKKYLNKDERDLLWISFRKRVKSCRKSWRVVSLSKDNDPKEDEKRFQESIEGFKKNIEMELVRFCESFLKLLDDTLLPSVENNHLSKDERKEAEIFYEKLRGDTYRYLWELVLGDKDKRDMRKKYGEKAKDAYVNAWRDAEKYLSDADPLRLGLALNYTVLTYEVIGDHQLAIDTAKSAVDKAEKDIDHLKGDERNDAEYIIDMLEENIKLWN